MSVFKPYWKQVKESHPQVNNTIVMSDEQKCIGSHKWNGVIPTVDPAVMEIQHKDLIDKPCDCQRVKYTESKCFCGTPKWEIKMMPNG